jgi:hypothetical protein
VVAQVHLVLQEPQDLQEQVVQVELQVARVHLVLQELLEQDLQRLRIHLNIEF